MPSVSMHSPVCVHHLKGERQHTAGIYTLEGKEQLPLIGMHYRRGNFPMLIVLHVFFGIKNKILIPS